MKPQSYVYQTYAALLERWSVGDEITLHDLVDAPGAPLGHYGFDVQERQRVSAALSGLARLDVLEREPYRCGKYRAFRVAWLSQEWSPRDLAVGLGCTRHRGGGKANDCPPQDEELPRQCRMADALAALDLAQEMIEEARAAIITQEN